jgi:hypothetical protein
LLHLAEFNSVGETGYAQDKSDKKNATLPIHVHMI